MADFPWGSIIGAAGNLIGGLMGQDSAKKSREAAIDQSLMQADLQREFAKNSIRWRVDDAKAAGIHPLAALGNPGISYAPVSVGGSADMSMPNAIAAMGQDIGRAVNATRTQAERDENFVAATRAQQLESGRLDNEIKRAELASRMTRLYHSSPNPSLPGGVDNRMLPGQGNSPLVKMKPQDVTRSRPGEPFYEPSPIPGVGFLEMPDGTLQAVKSKDAAELLEDDMLGNLKHFFSRTVLPMLGMGTPPKGKKLKPGSKWWVDWKGDFKQIPIAPNDLWRRRRHPSQR